MDRKLQEDLDLKLQELDPSYMSHAFTHGAIWMSQRTYSEDEVRDLVLRTVSTFSAFHDEGFKKQIAEEFFEINKKFLAQ